MSSGSLKPFRAVGEQVAFCIQRPHLYNKQEPKMNSPDKCSGQSRKVKNSLEWLCVGDGTLNGL